MRRLAFSLCLGLVCLFASSAAPSAAPGSSAPFRQAPAAPAAAAVRLAIVGLVHGHVEHFIRLAGTHPEVQIVGISDPDAALRAQVAAEVHLPSELFFDSLETMLDRVHPQAVATFTATFDHAAVVAACAKRGIHVMMEKPLAVSVEHGEAIAKSAAAGHIHVIVNYETTWYPSHAVLWQMLKVDHRAGDIRKMVAMDGHQGPKEINVGPEFLGWLVDPIRNGAGALFDFGCYGANLMTWLMDNARPTAVTALTATNKPSIYAHVDDEATVLLQYPGAQGIVQASWNWPFGRKDLEVYGQTGYAIATGGKSLHVRTGTAPEESPELAPLPANARDEVAYLASVVRGDLAPSGLSSLANNLIVTEILSAARESARTGRTVTLAPKDSGGH